MISERLDRWIRRRRDGRAFRRLTRQAGIDRAKAKALIKFYEWQDVAEFACPFCYRPIKDLAVGLCVSCGQLLPPIDRLVRRER